MFVIEAFYKGDNCNNHQHKCKEVIICNVHKHHPFLKTRNRWEHVPGCLIKYIIVNVLNWIGLSNLGLSCPVSKNLRW
nr:MAG TPA: hypothetical protein [Caudoviricetes sp.]